LFLRAAVRSQETHEEYLHWHQTHAHKAHMCFPTVQYSLLIPCVLRVSSWPLVWCWGGGWLVGAAEGKSFGPAGPCGPLRTFLPPPAPSKRSENTKGRGARCKGRGVEGRGVPRQSAVGVCGVLRTVPLCAVPSGVVTRTLFPSPVAAAETGDPISRSPRSIWHSTHTDRHPPPVPWSGGHGRVCRCPAAGGGTCRRQCRRAQQPACALVPVGVKPSAGLLPAAAAVPPPPRSLLPVPYFPCAA
jgi:hypothetical protein